MMEIVEEHFRREVAALETQRRGAALLTAGRVLLWTDLILACFVYAGLQAGSHLFLWWFLGQCLLGVALIVVGGRKRTDARRELAALAPPIGGHYQAHS